MARQRSEGGGGVCTVVWHISPETAAVSDHAMILDPSYDLGLYATYKGSIPYMVPDAIALVGRARRHGPLRTRPPDRSARSRSALRQKFHFQIPKFPPFPPHPGIPTLSIELDVWCPAAYSGTRLFRRVR